MALIALGAIGITAVFRVLAGLVLGESPARAVVSGAIFAVWFVPIFAVLMWALDRRRRRSLGLSGKSTLTTSNDPICVKTTCNATGSVDDVASVVERQITDLNGRPRRTTGPGDQVHVSADFGSRLALRFFGTSLSPGRRRMPMTLHVDLNGSNVNGAVATINAYSDEGWYLVRPSTFEAEYRRTLDELVSKVCEALTGYPSTGH